MERGHWHTSIDMVIFAGVSAIIVINLLRWTAAKAATQGGAIGQAGRSVGALVYFGS